MRTNCIMITCLIICFSQSGLSGQTEDTQKELMDAIGCSKLDIPGVQSALERGANPNYVSKTRRPLSVVGQLSYTIMCNKGEEKEEQCLQILKDLIKSGAKYQSCDKDILYFPIVQGWSKVTEAFIEFGANPEKPIDGETPMAIAEAHGQKEIVNLLSKHGGKFLDPTISGQLRLIQAASRGNIPAMDIELRNKIDINGKNQKGNTALYRITSFPIFSVEEYAALLYLLDNGADPKRTCEIDGTITTPLHSIIHQSSMVFSNKDTRDIHLYNRLVIETLIRHGAFVSASDGEGKTPLHVAAKYDNIIGAEILIKAGSKISPKDALGKTPLDYAESATMIKLLKDSGAKDE